MCFFKVPVPLLPPPLPRCAPSGVHAVWGHRTRMSTGGNSNGNQGLGAPTVCRAPCRAFVTVSNVTARFRKSKWSPWMEKVTTHGHAELSSIRLLRPQTSRQQDPGLKRRLSQACRMKTVTCKAAQRGPPPHRKHVSSPRGRWHGSNPG